MSTPYYEDDRATVYQGDMLAVLQHLESGSVDAVVTDPPYSSGGMVRADRMGKTATKYVSSDSGNRDRLAEFSGDNRDQRAYAYWMALWLSEALRITRPGGLCLLFTDWRQFPSTVDALQAGGWVWRGLVPWVKPAARPMLGRFTNQCEYVAWGSNGPMPADEEVGALRGFYQANPPRDREHITQKPLEVMRALCQIVPSGGTVLDPFTGSGTTGVAALLEGLSFIGCEMVPTHVDTTVRRLQEAQMNHRPDALQGAFDLGSLA